ncbi:MAG: OmpH family outer membrane protein, partial [Candidatus Omnitrophica bacterium]|nr:OmpH family outer membrane protein [Candidatus Omnitrophota bacterium]
VFEDYNKTKAFEEELQKEDEAKRDERAAMVDDIKKHRDELELLSSDKKAAKEKVIETKVQELQAFDRDWRLSLRRSRDEGLRDIIAEIEEVISTFGKDKGYDYIFNDRILLFKPDNQDITQKIVDLLNAKK